MTSRGEGSATPAERLQAQKEALIERFEKDFDLPAFLGQRGYRPSPDQPDALHLSMIHPQTGEALFLRKDVERSVWTYRSQPGAQDGGTITHYLGTREGLAREACLDRLIACALDRAQDPDAITYRTYKRNKPPELRAAEARHVAAVAAEISAERTLERFGVPRGAFDASRFGAIRSDADIGRVVNEPEGLAASSFRPGDRQLVFTERAFDAVAYERSRGQQRSCYMYTGSHPEPDTLRKIAHVLAELPPGMTVVLAFGRDTRGRELTEQVRRLAPALRMEREGPQLGARWGDQMQLELRHARSLTRIRPGITR